MCPTPIPGPDDGPIRRFFRLLPVRIIGIVILLALGVVIVGKYYGISVQRTVVEPCGTTPGSITVVATSGAGPVSYHWKCLTDPLWSPSAPPDGPQANLRSGDYELTLSNGIMVFDRKLNFTLTGLKDVSLVPTHPTGFTSGDGAIKTLITPPAEACNFAWSDGSTTRDRTGLDAGFYLLKVTDATNAACTMDRTRKLAPPVPAGCPDWGPSSAKVHPLHWWVEKAGTPPVFQRGPLLVNLFKAPFGPLGLTGCSAANFLLYIPAGGGIGKVLPYLERHDGTPVVAGAWTAGPQLNPDPATLTLNHLAAELLVTRLNMRNVDYEAPAPALRMAGAIYLAAPFTGYTVGSIVRMAERALDCSKSESNHDLTAQDFLDLHQALVWINDGGAPLTCPLCPVVYFQNTGDLPDDGQPQNEVEGLMTDISADGRRGVGYSAADDGAVANDGRTDNCPHHPQAQAFIRTCETQRFFPKGQTPNPGFPPNHDGKGLIGLGYLPTPNHAESVADGISPDGKVVVGYASAEGGGCGRSLAVVFTGTDVVPLQTPVGAISRAHDVTNAAVVAGPANQNGPFGVGRRIAVGYVSTGGNHPFRVAGARAVWWDPTGAPHDLPLPSTLPGNRPILSSNAVTVSDDGAVIGGELFFSVGGDGYSSNPEQKAVACVWVATAGGGYAPPVLLQEPAGGAECARVKQISGNGKVLVGYGWSGTDQTAIRWRETSGVWAPAPDVLPAFPGGGLSFASGVNYDGTVIVGTAAPGDWSAHFALRWTGGAVQDIAALLAAASPPVALPPGWQISAERVSADGKAFVGTGFGPGSENGEGWMARIP